MRTVLILATTDGKYVGKTAQTDLLTIVLPSGTSMEITGRAHLGNGVWKLWNSNYILKVEEVTNE